MIAPLYAVNSVQMFIIYYRWYKRDQPFRKNTAEFDVFTYIKTTSDPRKYGVFSFLF